MKDLAPDVQMKVIEHMIANGDVEGSNTFVIIVFLCIAAIAGFCAGKVFK